MQGVTEDKVQRQLQHFVKADPDYGQKMANALEVLVR
ncbi:hypothetical protein [Pseudomonas massiliensis]